jgi:hypothetical protein
MKSIVFFLVFAAAGSLVLQVWPGRDLSGWMIFFFGFFSALVTSVWLNTWDAGNEQKSPFYGGHSPGPPPPPPRPPA